MLELRAIEADALLVDGSWHADYQNLRSVLFCAVLDLDYELKPILILIQQALLPQHDVLFFRLSLAVVLPLFIVRVVVTCLVIFWGDLVM